MIIYKCAVSGDELFSDVLPMETVENVFYKVKGKLKPKEDNEIDGSLLGANASENPDEENPGDSSGGATASTKEMVVDVIQDYRLVETGFKKKDYQIHLKGYMKKVVDHLNETSPGRVDDFKKECQASMKKVLGRFDEYQFYMGESMDPDGMHILVEWEGETPYFYFFKDGLIDEKC